MKVSDHIGDGGWVAGGRDAMIPRDELQKVRRAETGEAYRRVLVRRAPVSVLWSPSANKPIEMLSKFMTAAPEASALESRVGHYYQVDDTYRVGREKVREFARAVQNYHPAHWNVAAVAELGYSGLVAPLTFTSAVPARDRVGHRRRRHRVQRPDQIAGPGNPHRCRHRRREVRWPEDLRPGDVERPLPVRHRLISSAERQILKWVRAPAPSLLKYADESSPPERDDIVDIRR